MRNYTSNGLLTFHHQPPWMFSQFIIILNGYFQFFLSTSMDIFIFHHQIQWIFSHFIIILNGYFRISLLTIIRNYPYITILTCVTYDNVLPFKPCGIWYVSLTLNYPLKRLTFGFFCFLTYLLELIP